jgi:hypothetical protein
LFGENSASPFTNEKPDIGTTLNQATAEIAAYSAGTEHQNLGTTHDRRSCSGSIAA